MRNVFIKGTMALMATLLLISLLPAATAGENSALASNTALENITSLNKTDNAGTIQSAILPERSSVIHIGKGLNAGSIGMGSFGRSSVVHLAQLQTNTVSNRPEIALSSPAKPMKDLEKVVFICNIL